MPAVSAKNFNLTPAATDLGLGAGDALINQVRDEEEENRRKVLTDQGSGLSASAMTLLGPMGR